jgi:hypothetical protein
VSQFVVARGQLCPEILLERIERPEETVKRHGSLRARHARGGSNQRAAAQKGKKLAIRIASRAIVHKKARTRDVGYWAHLRRCRLGWQRHEVARLKIENRCTQS